MWEIIAMVFGLILTALGTLIAWNLQAIKESQTKMFVRLDSQDERIGNLEKSYLVCRQNCLQTFVDKEDWLREAGNNREQLSQLTNTLSRMEGKMGVMEQLPAICGNIAREIAREMKGLVT